ncbi:MAG: DNA gyrase inhibitor YacG [Acidobacteria bacterium]|nr:DNA gyrase inhibitor YacG [Acidobacteriota bacterium]
MTVKVACPQCGQEVIWCDESPYRPFCSERCRAAELGHWFSETYRVAADEDEVFENE